MSNCRPTTSENIFKNCWNTSKPINHFCLLTCCKCDTAQLWQTVFSYCSMKIYRPEDELDLRRKLKCLKFTQFMVLDYGECKTKTDTCVNQMDEKHASESFVSIVLFSPKCIMFCWIWLYIIHCFLFVSFLNLCAVFL